MRRLLIIYFLFAVNSLAAQDRGDIVFNEILFNPRPGGTDFIELYNRSEKAVDLRNLKIAGRNANGQLTTATHLATRERILTRGAYCLLTADSFATATDYTLLDPAAVLELSRLPSMPDDKGKLVLLNMQNMVIDELHYDHDWHFKLLNNKEGISLERLQVTDSTQKPANWHSASSSSGYATPGYRNSQAYLQEQIESRFVIHPSAFSPDNDGRDDYVTITYKFSEPGYVMTIIIFDLTGNPVRSLARNLLCGITGNFRWDGLAEGGNRLSSGIYVLLIDCFNLQGNRQRTKKTVTLLRSY